MRRTVIAVHTTSDTDTTATLAELTARLDELSEIVVGLRALLAPPEPARWPGVGQVAQQLGVSRTTLHNWIRSGHCPARQWRGRWMIDPQWVAVELAVRTKPIAQ